MSRFDRDGQRILLGGDRWWTGQRASLRRPGIRAHAALISVHRTVMWQKAPFPGGFAMQRFDGRLVHPLPRLIDLCSPSIRAAW